MIALLLLLLPLQGGDPLSIGEQAYAEARYAAALEAFVEARATGLGNPLAVEHAAGVAALLAGRPLTALEHLHRARARLGSGHKAARAELTALLRRAESELGLAAGASEAPQLPWHTPAAILGAGLLLQCAAVPLLWRRKGGAAAVLLLAGLGLALYGTARLRAAPPAALLLADGQRLCSAPHEATAGGPLLPAGTGLRIHAASAHWCEVRAGDRRGWLPAGTLRRVQGGEPGGR